MLTGKICGAGNEDPTLIEEVIKVDSVFKVALSESEEVLEVKGGGKVLFDPILNESTVPDVGQNGGPGSEACSASATEGIGLEEEEDACSNGPAL